MTVCSHCGREGRTEDRYCQFCGQQLAADKGRAASEGVPEYRVMEADPEAWQGAQSNGHRAAVAAIEQESASASHASIIVATKQSETSAPLRLIVQPATPSADFAGGEQTSQQEREFPLDGRDLAIGRAPSCDIVLEGDQLASRRHALVRRKDSIYTIVDLGSSNGTYVNDLEIREATVLREGDRITVGSHEILVSSQPAKAASVASDAPAQDAAGVADGASAPLGATAASIPAANPISAPPAEVSPADGATPSAAVDEVAARQATEPVVEGLHPAATSADGAATDEPYVESATESMAVLSPAVAAQHAQAQQFVLAANDEPAPAATANATGPQAGDLEALRSQLADVGAALARKADEQTRTASRLRAALTEVRERLAMLTVAPAASASTASNEPAEDAGGASASSDAAEINVGELVAIARQAAQNPRHLDYLTSLASHANEIATALEAVEHGRSQQAHEAASAHDNEAMLQELADLRSRLDAALS